MQIRTLTLVLPVLTTAHPSFSPFSSLNNLTSLYPRAKTILGETNQPIEPERTGPQQEVTCTPNGHTCNGKELTQQVCAEQCDCYTDSGYIQCVGWSGCRRETVEWNCKCHSVPVPPVGKCKGFSTYGEALWAEKNGRWLELDKNEVRKHPVRLDVANF